MKTLLFILAMGSSVPFRNTTAPKVRALTIEERMLDTFRPIVGLKETPTGSNRGPLIDAMNLGAGASLRDPWCASFADWGYKKNGLKGRGAYSPTWFSKAKVVPPTVGAVGLVWFPAKGRYAHTVAIIESVRMRLGKPHECVTIEGNTNAQGSREGDQCARRIRAADSMTYVLWRDPI